MAGPPQTGKSTVIKEIIGFLDYDDNNRLEKEVCVGMGRWVGEAMVSRLAGRLTGWLVGWLAGWPVGSLV